MSCLVPAAKRRRHRRARTISILVFTVAIFAASLAAFDMMARS